MIAALPMLLLDGLKRIPWQAWALLALCALLWAFGHWRYNAGADAVQARWDAQEALYAVQRAKAAEDARKVEERHRAEYRAIADRFLKDAENAKLETDRVIAGLRSGSIRVRQRLTCPGLPGAAADSTGIAETGPRGLQPEDAADIVGVGAEADAVARQLNALIEAVKAGR